MITSHKILQIDTLNQLHTAYNDIIVCYSLDTIDIEQVKGCAFDYLTVYDGIRGANDSVMFGPVCESETTNLV
jgi:hypothetical protein